MDDKSEAADLALAEQTIWEGLRAYGALPDVELIENASVRAVLGPVPYEGFNAVFLSTPVELRQLHESLAVARSAKVPVLLHVWSELHNIESSLRAEGFEFYEEEPAMVASLEPRASSSASDGLSIAPVRQERDLGSWVTVLSGSGDERFIAGVVRLRSVLTEESQPVFEHLLGVVDGEVVACAAVYGGSVAAEVQHVVTDARFRRRGIGTAMTVAAMDLAATWGYSQAVLTASPDGAEIYRRLGFRTCGTVRRYIGR